MLNERTRNFLVLVFSFLYFENVFNKTIIPLAFVTSLFRTYGIVSVFLTQIKAKINVSEHRIKEHFIKRFSKQNRIVSG